MFHPLWCLIDPGQYNSEDVAKQYIEREPTGWLYQVKALLCTCGILAIFALLKFSPQLAIPKHDLAIFCRMIWG